jgi:hypothetical protein
MLNFTLDHAPKSKAESQKKWLNQAILAGFSGGL